MKLATPIAVLLVLAGCSNPASTIPSSSPTAIRPNGQERGGGDIESIRKAVLTPEIQNLSNKVRMAFENSSAISIRSMTSAFLSRAKKMPESRHRATILDMVARGAINDLQTKVQFLAQSECIDSFDGKKRSATAVMNAKNSSEFVVCFDPVKIATERGPSIPDADLVGLTVHELSHFYGHRDQDHSLAAAVTRFMTNEAYQIEGESLFHLVSPEVSEPEKKKLPFGWPLPADARRICYDSKIPKYRKLVSYLGNVIHSDVWVYLDRDQNASMPCFQEPVRALKASTKGQLTTLIIEVLETERVESIYLQDDFGKMISAAPTGYSTSESYKRLLEKSQAGGLKLNEVANPAATIKATFVIRRDQAKEIGVVKSYWETSSGEIEGAIYVDTSLGAVGLQFDTSTVQSLIRFGNRACGTTDETTLDRGLESGMLPSKIKEAYYQLGVGETPKCSK